MKIKHIFFLMTIFFCMTGGVFAEGTDNNLYVIDIQRVINESPQGKAARDIVEATVKKEGAKLEQLQGSLKKLQADLEKQSSLLSGEALAEKQDQYRKKERELSNMYDDQKQGVEIKNRTEIGKVVEQIDKILKEIAKDKAYNFIIEKDPRVVVYASSEYDITNSVIEAMGQ